MKSNFTITALFLFLSLLAYSQTEKKVLFIGNSYTGVNNLPLMVQNMTESAGDVLIYDANTPGGVTLQGHSTNAVTLQKIGAGDWDYVVLQEQSQLPSFPTEQVESEVYPYAELLCDTIRALNDCAQPMFYMTWGRENGDEANCQFAPWLCTYEGMDDSLRSRYIHMAEINAAELSPVGAVWRFIRENHPEIDLYSADGSHPSMAGSYAAGCAFYATIFENAPTLITWNSTLSESEASIIKNATQTVVYNALDSWDFSINPAIADFSEVIDLNIVSFTNTSEYSDSLIWNFGDGSGSGETNPIHQYAQTGTYTVTLINWRCNQSDTLVKTLTINAILKVNNAESESFIRLFPNPASQSIQIVLNRNTQHTFYFATDLTGKRVIEKSVLSNNSVIDISHLVSGMYILNVFADGEVHQLRMQKID